jgi:hypothetical protein
MVSRPLLLLLLAVRLDNALVLRQTDATLARIRQALDPR